MTSATRYRFRLAAASAAIFVVLTAVSYRLFGALAHARFRLIDDHEIVRFLGPDHAIGISEIPGLLAGTEVGQWGDATRLRPVYYLFRIVEAALWRDDVALWYGARLVAVAIVGTAVAFLVLRAITSRESTWSRFAVNSVVALALGIATVLLPAWTDIAGRLGPSEVYVALGLVPFAIGMTEVWRNPHRWSGWVLIAVGYLVIVGSKEDGVLFALPLAVVIWVKFREAGRVWLPTLVAAVCAVATAYILLGITIAIAAASGRDVYGESRSILIFGAAVAGNPYLFPIALVLAAVVLLALRASVDRRLGRVTFSRVRDLVSRHGFVVAAAALLFLALGDLYFYQTSFAGGHFSPPRYGILTQLAVVAAFIVIMAQVHASPARTRALRVAIAMTIAGSIVLSPVGAGPRAAVDTSKTSANTSEASQALAASLEAGADELRSRDASQAVLIVDDLLQYEPVYAVPQFLAFYGAADQAILIDQLAPAAAEGESFSADLARQLQAMADEGKTTDRWRILPSTALDSSAYVVCFVFSRSTEPIDACDSVHVLG